MTGSGYEQAGGKQGGGQQAGGRRHRRVQVPGAEGADPEPQRVPRSPRAVRASDTDRVAVDRDDSNDARLRDDVPPHWG